MEGRLKQNVENNIALEQYTRLENLRFNNIKKKKHEDCKAVRYNVSEKQLAVATEIRFQTIHRVDKKIPGRRIPRFVCREDRDKIWSARGKLKQSITQTNAYNQGRLRQGYLGETEGIDQSYDESPPGTWSK